MVVILLVVIYYLIGKWILIGERMIVFYINVDGNYKFIINKLFLF